MVLRVSFFFLLDQKMATFGYDEIVLLSDIILKRLTSHWLKFFVISCYKSKKKTSIAAKKVLIYVVFYCSNYTLTLALINQLLKFYNTAEQKNC